MDDFLKNLSEKLAQVGLSLRGGFHSDNATTYLIGHGGSSFWDIFQLSEFTKVDDDPLDSWTKQVVGNIAEELDARAIYPSDGPPYAPFQRWVNQAEGLLQSPIGILMHPDYGLWHAYRAALVFEGEQPLPEKPIVTDVCETCEDRPCLNSCPVSAFKFQEYDYKKCADFLKTDTGADCMSNGCLARRSCPIGQSYIYEEAHAAFHMKAFSDNH